MESEVCRCHVIVAICKDLLDEVLNAIMQTRHYPSVVGTVRVMMKALDVLCQHTKHQHPNCVDIVIWLNGRIRVWLSRRLPVCMWTIGRSDTALAMTDENELHVGCTIFVFLVPAAVTLCYLV